ncbi:capsular biosynthesis protein [Bacillus sp. AFS015802]|uniref:CapA family protein n=1 Tax=Bacillus sp. AFS015802 TaxID=2033486 RepID=UPI000BF5FCDC|nr:CapA family protein [Bacillus sp. AFS015802]PFA62216.1 capsular biosynthesis protein [Bacillus sp. AFS015802]
MNKKRVITGMAICLPLLLVMGFLITKQYSEWNTPSGGEKITSLLHSTREVQASGKSFKASASLAAIGDILIHDTVYNDAKNQSGYDFTPMFSPIKEMLSTPDFLIANQESTPGGVELGVSSYPLFNSPKEVVKSLQEVGVDAVTTANNHSLDQGEKGLMSAIDYYEKLSMPYVGAFKSREDQNRIRTFNVNGIKFALLSYTYGTNGIPVPEGKEYLVNLIDEQKMIQEIQKAKGMDIDLVVMSLHWGNEYQRFPTEEQQRLAKVLTDSGVDIIFGHHPHVLQPIQTYKTSDGRDAVVVYSLGNFLSGQKDDYKDIGGMVTVQIEKKMNPAGSSISFPSIQFQPTFVSENHYKNYRIYPLDFARKNGMISNTEEEMVSHMVNGLPN